MAKMHKLIQNEYIKTWKKLATKMLFVIIVLAVAALVVISKLIDYDYKKYLNEVKNEAADFSYAIKEAETKKYPGYETDLEKYEFLLDNNVTVGSWKIQAASEAYSYEVNKKSVTYNHSAEIRAKMLQSIEKDDWKKFCELMVQSMKSQGKPEDYYWEYQYRLNKNIPLPDTTADMLEYPNDVIRSIAGAKNVLADYNSEEGIGDAIDTKTYDEMIAMGMYRLENNLKVNVLENKDFLGTGEINFWTVFGQSSSLITVVGVLIIIVAGSSVANEFSQGTIKFLLINPVKRWKILVSKYVMCISMGFLMVLLLFVLSLLASMIFYGTDTLGSSCLELKNNEILIENGIAYVFKNYMYRSVEVLVMATLAFAISSVAKNSAMAIGISLFAMLMGSSITSLLKTELQQDWVRYLVFANTDFSSVINGTSGFANHSLPFAIGVVAIHMLVFFLIAWDGFTKREI